MIYCEAREGESAIMAYEKLLNEIYAVVSLKYLWREYKPSFIKSESPDWINETMNLGLEVSQALLPDDGQTKSFIDQYLGCLKEELPFSAIERYGERLNFYNGRFWAVLPDDMEHQDYLFKAKYRFDKKLEKLNTSYQHKRYNGLYLFLHPIDESNIDVKHLFEYMGERQKYQEQHFDWVFLNCERVIYVCDYINNTTESIVLPQNAADFLNTESEYLRYCGTWENGVSLEDATILSGRGDL